MFWRRKKVGREMFRPYELAVIDALLEQLAPDARSTVARQIESTTYVQRILDDEDVEIWAEKGMPGDPALALPNRARDYKLATVGVRGPGGTGSVSIAAVYGHVFEFGFRPSPKKVGLQASIAITSVKLHLDPLAPDDPATATEAKLASLPGPSAGGLSLASGTPRQLHAYLEYVGGASSKFYAVSIEEEEGGTWRVRFNFGRIGFPRAWGVRVEGAKWPKAANAAYVPLLDEKRGKGYEFRQWPAYLQLPDGATLEPGESSGGADAPDEVLFRAAERGSLPPETGGPLAGTSLPVGTLFRTMPEGGSRGEAPVLWASASPLKGRSDLGPPRRRVPGHRDLAIRHRSELRLPRLRRLPDGHASRPPHRGGFDPAQGLERVGRGRR